VIIKCNRCKHDFDVSSIHTKFCMECKITNKLEYNRKYKKDIRHNNSIIKCKVCLCEFLSTNKRVYCSRQCSQDINFIPKQIARREQTLIRKMNELQLLKEKYVHLL